VREPERLRKSGGGLVAARNRAGESLSAPMP
jgi:hypothetical protein